MQKIGLILFLAHIICINLSGQTDTNYPPITLESFHIRVGEVLEEISRQSGLNFSFNSRLIDTDRAISFSVKEASLEETLQQLSQKLQVIYSIIEGQIVLSSPPKPKKNNSFTLSGFLTDKSSGESLIGATIRIIGTPLGTYSNEFGFYSLSLKRGKYQVQYSHLGYEKVKEEVILEKEEQKSFSLPPVSYQISPIEIGPSLLNILDRKQLGQMELSPDELNNMPEFAGESGIVKGLQSLPGIKADGDGSAYFFARGGERDQNVIIIDDAPIYNPSHLFGFYSMVIPDFAKSIRVYKSDMPAVMGDRLSSIISIRTKDGNLNKFEVSGVINPFVSRYSIETPIKKKKSAIFLTFRHSNLEWIFKKSNPLARVNFRDFHFKWNRILNKNNRVFITAISSSDFFQTSSDAGATGINRDNFAGTLRWNHVFGPKLFSNTILYTGSYSNRLLFTPNFWKAELGMLSIKSDFTHYANPDFQSKFGLEIQGYFTNPGSLTDTAFSIFPNVKPNYSRKRVGYYQGKWNLRENLKLNAGLRLISWESLGPASYYTYDNTYEVNDTLIAGSGVYNTFTNLDPRVSLQYQLDKTSQVKFSYGKYHQYLQLISNSISPFTSLEVWLPASPTIRPQSSRQWSLSYLKYFERSKLEISAAAYHKGLRNQIDYKAHAITYLNPLLEGELRFGRSKAYGIEFLLKKNVGRLNAWAAYTYSRTFRKTPGINEGRRYPAIQDRPHDFSLFLSYPFSRRLIGSVYWTSYSGAAFSSPTGFLNFNDQPVPIYTERNNDRLPAYHRMDLSVKFLLNKKESSRYQHSLTFSIYNALAHKNVYVAKFNKISGNNGSALIPSNVLSDEVFRASQIDLARFFPSLSYRFSR